MRTKRLLLYLLIGFAAVVIVFLVVVALQPAEFKVTRSVTVGAPPDAVFPHVNVLKNWEAWNPWGKIDPKMKLTYDGPPAGVGASYSWAGNSQVGEGRATITDSQPNERVQLKLEFFKPMAGVSVADFTFQPRGEQTQVNWAMTGENNFIGKAICLFVSMDAMIGGQFEKGLAELKRAAESGK
jgi:hypothetical protein